MRNIFLAVFALALLFAPTVLAQSAPKYTLYYLHNSARCMSCLKIEDYTRKAYDEFFKDKVDFKVLNIDEPENAHFINDYKLYTKSVVISKTIDGKEVGFKNLEQVWYLLSDENEYKNYINTEVSAFMKE